jgi:hypothetical protein
MTSFGFNTVAVLTGDTKTSETILKAYPEHGPARYRISRSKCKESHLYVDCRANTFIAKTLAMNYNLWGIFLE